MSYETIQYNLEDGLARIIFNRPEAGNSINRKFAHEFMDVAIKSTTDPEVRCILISAAGPMYSFGGDLKFFATEMEQIESTLIELTAVLHQGIQRFHNCKIPVIIAVNGMAAGGGFSMALFGDIVFAARSAKFVMAYTNAGLSPDGSSSYYLPRVVGLRRAQELMYTNRLLTSEEAQEWGLVTFIAEDEKLQGEAEKLGKQLANGPTKAYGAVKYLLSRTFDQSLENQLEEESKLIASMAGSIDGREGLDAFLNKRKPSFKGM
ncbi:MAG: enoyl-CoA hydratase [Rhodospirillaceae bacterium]|nr:enoyl-CoA hydratase [Rhodospirillaceae bacterium]